MNIKSPATASQLADVAAEAIRDLNHATHPGNGYPALTYPSDVYSTLANLAVLVSRLPQVFDQLQRFVTAQVAAGQVSLDDGAHPGDPFAAAAVMRSALADAAGVADLLHRLLEQAQAAIAFASYVGEVGRNKP
jgi:hypothetical protein